MAVLTWRNVDAPNFSGALEGYRTASQLLSNAVRSGQDAVGAFTQANADAADRAILNRALGVQGSDAYQAALASGAITGPDAARASLDTLRGLDNRVGTLLNRDVTRENLGQAQYLNERGRTGDALMDAAGPDASLFRTLMRDNNQESASRLLQTSETLRALRPEQQAPLLAEGDRLTSGAQGRWRFGNEQRDATDAQSAQETWLSLRESNATNSDMEESINRVGDTMTPGARAKLENLARGAGYNINGPVNAGSGGAAPSAAVGGTNDSLIGRFINGLAKLETAGGKKTVKGPAGEDSFNLFNIKDFSAAGTGYRARDTAEGSNDRYRTYGSADESRADLMELLARKYPKALTARNGQEFAQALKNGGYATDPDYVKKLTAAIGDTSDVATPEAARASLDLGVSITRQMLRERAGQNQATGIFPELNALQGDRRTASEVVGGLIGKEGPFAGSNRGEMLDIVNDIVQRSGNRINPAMAGEIIARNVESEDGTFIRGWSRIADVLGTPFGRQWSTPDMAGGVRIKDRGVRQSVDDYLSGATSTQRMAQQSIGAEDALVVSLQERYNAADAQYNAMVSAARSRPGLEGSLERLKQRRDAAEQALRRVVQSNVNNESLTPIFDRPVGTSTARR